MEQVQGTERQLGWLPGGDLRIVILALIAIVILSVMTVIAAPAPPAPPLSVHSSEADGALAMQLWLSHSGYTTQEVTSFTQLGDVDTLFLLEPSVPYSDDDAQRLQNWVRQGHTLILAGDPFSVNVLLAPYQVSLSYLDASVENVTSGAPTLLAPPVSTVQAEAIASVQTDRASVTAHLFANDSPVLVSFDEGKGLVWVFGALRPFTNRGLRDPGSPELIANFLANVPKSAVIGFDEGGHGFGDATQQSFGAWLLGTPPGLGILTGIVLTMAYLALRGRHFGKAVPLPEEQLRRESVEYIQAMGTLFRRSGQRAEVLRHYDEQLRRRLSERYALDPALDHNELVKAVVYHDPTVDEKKLRGLLNDLARQDVSEAALVKIASELDDFLRGFH